MREYSGFLVKCYFCTNTTKHQYIINRVSIAVCLDCEHEFRRLILNEFWKHYNEKKRIKVGAAKAAR